MTTIKEITELRKNGAPDKAYEECKKLLEANPEDIYARVAMGYCVKDLMEASAKAGDVEGVCQGLAEYGSLRLDEHEEGEMANKAVWGVRTLLLGFRGQEGDEKFEVADRLAEAIKAVEFKKPHRYYSVLLDAFLTVKSRNGRWPGLIDFIDWWGLENLLPEDYSKVLLNNGARMNSLAERAYTSYSKMIIEALEEGNRREEAAAFLPELQLLNESHPEFTYTLYHTSLILKGLGRMDEAAATARGFVKRKENDFWSWAMLGDVLDNDDLRLASYCRALTCKSAPIYLVKVRQKAGLLMAKRGDFANAKKEFEEIIALHTSKGWRIPTAVEEMTRQPWYAITQAEYDNRRYYFEHMGPTDVFLLGDVPEVPILITKYNPQKQICSFVTNDQRRGFFSTKRLPAHFADNQIYKVRFGGEINDKTPSKVLSLEKVDNGMPYENIFWRRLNGEMNMRPGQTFTFIEGVYVDGSLVEGIEPGTEVEITAVLYYNLKYNSWAWRAVRVVAAR